MKQMKLLSIPGLIASAMLLAAAASPAVVASDAVPAGDGPDAADSGQVAAQIEELTRSYFRFLGEFDLAAMWDMSTPEFEIFEHDGTRAMRMDLQAFDERLRGAQQAGAQIRFEPGNFRTTVTPTGAWTFYVERGLIPSNQDRRFYGTTIWKRVGDRWLLDKMVSLPVPQGSPNFPE
jgi:hypothetical protein